MVHAGEVNNSPILQASSNVVLQLLASLQVTMLIKRLIEFNYLVIEKLANDTIVVIEPADLEDELVRGCFNDYAKNVQQESDSKAEAAQISRKTILLRLVHTAMFRYFDDLSNQIENKDTAGPTSAKNLEEARKIAAWRLVYELKLI